MENTIKICIDKNLPPDLRKLAKELAIRENPANEQQPRNPFELAVESRFLWKPGSTINVGFLSGEPWLHEKVEYYAHRWEQYANIRFNFTQSQNAQIRIAFRKSDGSWSYLGTHALAYTDPTIPTMNYGWFDADTDEDEYSRVVLHEFGHALGCIHEHQNPENGIPWNIDKAYAFYRRQGWTTRDVDIQVFRKYSKTITQFSTFDPNSIMMYPIPSDITIGGFSVGWNRELSSTDKEFIGRLYPF